jgi:hypothetical protein
LDRIITIFLKSDVKAFFGRVCADGLSDSDIAAIVDKFVERLKKRNEVCARPSEIFVSSHVRSLLLLEKHGKSNEKRKKMKLRNNSNHYVTRSAMLVPISERILTHDSRVVGKLKEEGWAQELETHPSAYAGLKEITGVRVAKPLTDKGTSFVGHS